MVHSDLSEFLHSLIEAGELRRVVAEVDPCQEVAEITDRVSKTPGGGKALLFTAVSGSYLPVATNLFGSERRLALALGMTSLGELTCRMERLLEGFAGPVSGATAWLARRLMSFSPVEVPAEATWEIVESKPDLMTLPALGNWSGDGGRYFTLPLVFTRDIRSGARNCGIYRFQVLDGRRGAINFNPGSGGGRHCAAYAEDERPMPVAVVLGGLPESIFAATVPLPDGIDELALAGCLRRRPIEVAPVCGGALTVPATSDVVIEGEIHPGDVAVEGPFGNHTGRYTVRQKAPVFRVLRILRKKEAVVPATIVGPPPMEDCLFVRGWERLLRPWLQLHVPAVRDVHLLLSAAFFRAAVVAADASVAAKDLVCVLRRTEPLKGSKFLVIIDPEVNPEAYEDIFWRAVNALPAGLIGAEAAGGGIAVDARGMNTCPLARSAATVAKVTQRWQEYGIDL